MSEETLEVSGEQSTHSLEFGEDVFWDTVLLKLALYVVHNIVNDGSVDVGLNS